MRFVCFLRTRKYKLEDARSPFFEAVDMVAEEAKDGFLGGEKPSAADFNVFGVLRSLESFTTERLMLEHTKIGPWYRRMAEMHAARGQGSKLRGAFQNVDMSFFPSAQGIG
jgi:glutathione S-transferase